MNLQEKSEKYWGKAINPKRRQQSYFDEYFDDECNKKSLDFRVSKILNHDPTINSILDVGCGYGAFLHEISNRNNKLKLGGIDICEEAINFCKKTTPKINFVNDKLNNITKHFKKYDIVYTSAVMVHQSPEVVDSLIDNFLKISKKYIIHFEDIGNDELICGEEEHNPEWRIHPTLQWKNNLIKSYKDRGYNFYYGCDVPQDLQRIGFTNYIIVEV